MPRCTIEHEILAHLAASGQPVLGCCSAVVERGTNNITAEHHAAVLSLLHQLAQVVHFSAAHNFILLLPCLTPADLKPCS